MAGKSASILVRILGDGDSASKAADDVGSKFEGMAGKLGKAGLAIGAALGAGALGAVIGLEKIGATFDDAFDSIAVQTGATGTALDDLGAQFKDVFTSIPVSAEDAANAIGTINQRLGQTGDPLEELSKQFLNLSRITDTDLTENINSAADAFNAFGIGAEGQGPALDKLFKLSQKSGVAVADLAAQMADGAPVFNAAGLSFDQVSSMLSNLAKYGLSASDVLPGLSKAIGLAASEGVPAGEAIENLFNKLRDAPDDTTAAGIAFEILGAKAGPKFAELIRSGQLSLEDFTAAAVDTGAGINETAAATDDWREKLTVLKNKVLLKLEPLAGKVFAGITTAIEMVTPHLERFGAWLGEKIPVAFAAVQGWVEDNWPKIRAVILDVFEAIVDIWDDKLQPALQAIGEGLRTAFNWVIDNKPVLIGVLTAIGVGVVALFTAWAVGAATAAAATLAAIAPFVAIGAAIAAVVAGVIYAYQNWEWFRQTVDGVATFLRDTLWPILQDVFGWLRDNVPPIIQAIAGWITDSFIPALQSVYSWISDYVFPVVQKLAEFFVAYWTVAFNIAKVSIETLVTAVTTLWGWFQTLWDRSEGLRAFLAGAFSVGIGVATGAFVGVKNALLGVWEWLQTMWDRSEGLRSFFAGAFAIGIDVAEKAVIGVKNALLGVWEWLQTAWDKAVEVAGYFEGAFTTAIGIAKGAWDGMYGIISSIVEGLKKVIEWAGKAIEKLKEVATNAGKAALGPISLLPGFAAGGRPKPGMPSIVGERGWELFIPDSSGTVIPHDQSVDMLRDQEMMASGGLFTPGQMAALGGPGGNVYNINVVAGMGSDAREIGDVIIDEISSYERRNGTSWRQPTVAA
jgi:TP901 family phage tail tape measure protein